MRSLIAGFSRSFWRFLFAENLYDIGLYIFVLIYNLYLLDLGYREDFLGWVTGAMAAGNIIGSLPAAAVVRRLGLKLTVMLASAGVAILCICRSTPLSGDWLIGTAFVAGVLTAIWAVSVVPIVAALTTEHNRASGYSLWVGWGIGLGVVCGVLAGNLPGWIQRSGLASNATSAKHHALILGAVAALLSPLILARLSLTKNASTEVKVFPRNPFVVRYLLAYTVWNAGVGVFNPFFSAYFARQLHLSISQIGFIFSASQLAQLCGLMAAPALLRRCGMVSGISIMQAGVAVSLMALAMGPSAFLAGILYALYALFQYVSEPGTFTLLMSRVDPSQRAGASALNFFVTSLSQAVAAAVAGMVVVRFGYQPVLIFASVATGVAAYLFQRLLHPFSDSATDGDACLPAQVTRDHA